MRWLIETGFVSLPNPTLGTVSNNVVFQGGNDVMFPRKTSDLQNLLITSAAPFRRQSWAVSEQLRGVRASTIMVTCR
jgi:hypothetical protein